MNGVSTLDLVMMQRHILGVAPFHNAYKMVAADVNNDSKVKCERHGGIEEADSGLDHPSCRTMTAGGSSMHRRR